jgi:hypothetical protein
MQAIGEVDLFFARIGHRHRRFDGIELTCFERWNQSVEV